MLSVRGVTAHLVVHAVHSRSVAELASSSPLCRIELAVGRGRGFENFWRASAQPGCRRGRFGVVVAAGPTRRLANLLWVRSVHHDAMDVDATANSVSHTSASINGTFECPASTEPRAPQSQQRTRGGSLATTWPRGSDPLPRSPASKGSGLSGRWREGHGLPALGGVGSVTLGPLTVGVATSNEGRMR